MIIFSALVIHFANSLKLWLSIFSACLQMKCDPLAWSNRRKSLCVCVFVTSNNKECKQSAIHIRCDDMFEMWNKAHTHTRGKTQQQRQLKCGKRVRTNRVTFGWIGATAATVAGEYCTCRTIAHLLHGRTKDATRLQLNWTISSLLSLTLSLFFSRSLARSVSNNEDDCMF